MDEQLGELYNELRMEGRGGDLNLEEGCSRYSSPAVSGNEDEDTLLGTKGDEKAASEQETTKPEGEGKVSK